jgi:threonine dehydratase
MKLPVSLEDVRAAAGRIASGIYRSPCPPSIPLSELTGCEVYCKLDYLQRTGSFKERGARNALLQLDETNRKRGIITASAGNHGLGLAYHGKLLAVPVTVVMPRFAPLTKAATCRELGAMVILHGDNFDEAREYAVARAESTGQQYIHGFNDPAIIAGQGTTGLEIVEDLNAFDAVVAPIGGGGLIAGMALAIKGLRPGTKIIGVEPTRAASFTAALNAGHPIAITTAPTLADGLGARCVGENAFRIAQSLVDRVVTVGERGIAKAILKLIELEKSVVEGAGAAGLAALMSGELPELEGKRVVLPLTGGNIDTTVIGRVIERGLAADGRLCRFQTVISDRPGGLARLTRIIAEEGGSIMDIAHDRAFSGEDIQSVTVHCVVETRDEAHVRALGERLEREGLSAVFQEVED